MTASPLPLWRSRTEDASREEADAGVSVIPVQRLTLIERARSPPRSPPSILVPFSTETGTSSGGAYMPHLSITTILDQTRKYRHEAATRSAPLVEPLATSALNLTVRHAPSSSSRISSGGLSRRPSFLQQVDRSEAAAGSSSVLFEVRAQQSCSRLDMSHYGVDDMNQSKRDGTPLRRSNSTAGGRLQRSASRASLWSNHPDSQEVSILEGGVQGHKQRKSNSAAAWGRPSSSSTMGSRLTTAEIARVIEEACGKVDSTANGASSDPHNQAQKVDFRALCAGLMKLSRPVWTLAKKYVRDRIPTNAYRMHIRSLWRFAAGKVIVEQAKTRLVQARDAKKALQELIRNRHTLLAKEKKKRRAELATAFFAEILPKKRRAVVPPLTREYYRSLHARFREICDAESMILVIRDLSGKVDSLILRRIDRDRSGTISFEEILKMAYPNILARDLQAMIRKWDTVEAELVSLPTAQLLAPDAHRQIEVMFRKCDTQGKGVLTRQDMTRMFVPPGWDDTEPLWFGAHFPTVNSVVSYDEFMEMIKFCFPPFRSGVSINRVEREPFKPYQLPQELLDAQEKANVPF